MQNAKQTSLLVVNTVPFERNGISFVIYNLLNSLDKKDMRIGIVAISDATDEKYLEFFKENGIKLHVIPRSMRNPLRYLKELAKVAKDYDALYAHGNSATMILEMTAAKAAGVGIRMAHSHSTTCSAKLIHRLAKPAFLTLCNRRIACGREAGEWLFGKKDFTIINNGVDTGNFAFDNEKRKEIRAKLNIGVAPLIGGVGNFEETKNQKFTLGVFREILKKRPDARLIFLGDGPLKEQCIEYAESLGLGDKVIFAGSVGNVNEYLNAIDVILMPSLFEGFPLTLVEEQANGLHCLCSDNITRDTNLSGNLEFISLEDTEKWAQIADALLSASGNREETSRKAIADISAKGYDIGECAKKLKSLIHKI